MPTEAGQGEHHVYRILPAVPPDAVPLTPRLHYLGVDAVAWFINKQGNWFSDRMASGTLEVTLSSGLEKYHAALGTFELKAGAKIAPVFEAPVLPDRNFLGGPITLNASLTAIKKDTVLAGMLKSAASASLGIVAGMVQTATVTGPAKLLAVAGEDLVNGVKRVLSDTGDKREALFDFSGLQFSMQADGLLGREIFILMHRGAPLPEKQLSVRQSGQLVLPYIGEQVLSDGAWLLLRLRRSDEYKGAREWYGAARNLRSKISSLVDDVASEIVTKDKALEQLQPSSVGNATIFDEFAKLRTIIQTDYVLSERQAGAFVGELNAALTAARKAIASHKPDQFKTDLAQLTIDLAKGNPLENELGRAFKNEITGLANFRAEKSKGETLDVDDIASRIRFMPHTLSEFSHPGGIDL